MAVSIADLFVTVGADISGATTGLTQIGNQLTQTTRQFQAAAPAALVLAGAGAAVETGFAGAVKVAASFEQAMANVRAVMTPDEARTFGGALGDLAVHLGQQTVFSAREAAAGIGELVKAGISAPDVLNGAGAAALNLAAATGISVANAATVAAQTMNAFHKSASELTGVVDVLAGVTNATAADMSDLQFGLQVVSATSQTMGLSFEDTATAIGVFVSAGETGATAGTGLRQMLLELIPTTKPATEEMKKLGLITADGGNAFFDAAGHVKSMADISQVLQNALKGMSDEQRIAALNTLFTRDAINSATILANLGAAGMNNYETNIRGASDAGATAGVRLGTLQGALNNLGSSFETVQIIVGNLFLPVLSGIAQTVRGVVDQFSNLSQNAQGFVVAVAGIGGALSTVLGGAVLLAPVIRALGPSFAAVGSILIRIAPFFLRLAGVAGLLFAAWEANLFHVRDLVEGAFSQIPDVLDRLGSAFGQAGTLWENNILPAIQTIGSEIEQRLIPVFNGLAPVVQGFVDRVGPILGNLGLVFQKVMGGDIGGALDTFKAVLIALAPNAAGFIDVVGRLADGLGRFAGDVGAGLLDFFTVKLPPVLDSIGQFAGGVGAGLLEFFNTVVLPIADTAGRFAVDIGTGLTTFFTQTLPPIIEQIGAFAGGVGDAMLTFFTQTLVPIAQSAAQFAGDIGSGLATFFTVTLPPILAQIGQFSGDAVQPLVSFLQDHLPPIADAVSKFGGDVGAGMVKFFTIDLPPVIAIAGTVTADTFAAMVDFFQTQGPIIIAGVQKFGALQTQPLTDFFAQFDAIKAQVESLQPLFAAIGNFGTSLNNLEAAITGLLARTFGTLLKDEFDIFGNTLKNFADTVAPVQPTLDAIGTTVETLGQRLAGVTDFINNGAAALQRLADSLNNIPADKLPGANAGGFGLNPDLFNGNITPDTPIFKQTAFRPGEAAGGAGGPLVAIGQLIISNEAEAEAFLQRMAAAVRASAGRVTPPPDNSAFPSLSTGVI